MECLKKCKCKELAKHPFIQGRGNIHPELMIIGIAPGKWEDAQGEVFVGDSGEYLDRALSCLDDSIKDSVYLSNVVRCRVVNEKGENRNPSAAEVRACIPYLHEEINRLKPKLIMTMGQIPFIALTGMDKIKIGQVVGHPYDFTLETGESIKILPCYHPAATLHTKTDEEREKYHKSIMKTFGIAEDILLGNYKENKEGWKHYVITTPEGIPTLIEKFSKFKFVTHDLETNTVKPFRDELKLYTASFGFPDKTCYCLVCDHPHFTFKPPANWHSIWMDTLRTIFSMTDITFICHKLKFEMSCIYETFGIILKDAHDTLLMHYILDERPPHDLEFCGQKYLDEPDWKYESESYLAQVKSNDFGDLPLDIITRRNNKDAEVPCRLSEKFIPMLEEDGTYAAYEHTVGQIEPLMMIEKNGIKVDLGRVDELIYRFTILKRVFDKALYACEEVKATEAYFMMGAIAKNKKLPEGWKFNPGSSPQKQYLLYNVLKIPVTMKTNTGQPSTKIDVLVQHLNYPVCRYLGILSKVNYYLNNVLIPMRDEHQGKDGRVHSEFNIGRVQTGRLSGSEPNPQNVNKKMKYIFIAEKDSFYIEPDFGQFELRILAALSGDENMKSIFERGGDIHSEVAMEKFGVADEFHRRVAKGINFGIPYGMGPKGLADKLNSTIAPEDRNFKDFTPEEAAEYIEAVNKKFPMIPIYKEDRRNFLRKNDYMEDLFGKRRRYKGFRRVESYDIGKADSYFREAFNFLVQGPAGEITLVGIDELTKKGYKIVNTVHDSILIEIKKVPGVLDGETAQIEGGKIKAILENLPLPFKLDMQFKVDVKWGYDWMHLEEVK